MNDGRVILHWGLDATAARLERVLDGVTDEDAAARPSGLTPIAWQVGHLGLVDALAVRRSGAAIEIPEGYDEVFSAGTGGAERFPPLAELRAFARAAHQGLVTLAREAPLDRPIPDVRAYTTVGQALAFLLYHRGYHIGKMATLRALLGKVRVFG
ncbi:MAG: DinB family protein [Armatimonadota bacterium]|nr:DinB family protein [Armatimonadota bacterium]